MSYAFHDWKPAFLAAIAEVPVLRHGCDVARVHRDTVLKARKADPTFDEAVETAMEAGVDRAEQEAFRRAVVGFEEPVVHQGVMALRYQHDEQGRLVLDENGKPLPVIDERGQPVPLTIRKHSDTLLSLVLKGRRKRVYADRTELTGADGGPVATADATQRAARAATLLKLAEARKAIQAAEVDINDLV